MSFAYHHANMHVICMSSCHNYASIMTLHQAQ